MKRNKISSFIRFSTDKNRIELKNIAFDTDYGIYIQSWMRYFDNLCEKEGTNAEWKLENIPKNLKEQALKIYINECLGCTNNDQIADFLTKTFITINVP